MDVDRLWAGWRLSYVQNVDADEAERGREDACVFCRLPELPEQESLVVERGERAFSVLNLYPYNTGHVMVLPYRHVGELENLTDEEAAEVMHLMRRALRALKAEYEPDGANLGANLGRAAGAGIPEHFHMHVLPRWSGDTNYVTVIGGVKVMPEDLSDTWRRISERLESLDD